MKIFIIYRFNDEKERAILVDRVKSIGIANLELIYLKKSNGCVGWKHQSEELINKCECVVVLNPKGAEITINQQAELDFAKQQAKPIFMLGISEYELIAKNTTDCSFYKWMKCRYNFTDEFEATSLSSDEKILLEQYKILVQTSEAMILRRQTTNAFYVTITGGIIAIIGFVIKEQYRNPAAFIAIQCICLIGCVICVSWNKLLVNFGRLNSGKFKAISKIEQALKSEAFALEWISLGKGLRPEKYQSFTETEAKVPIFFAFCYMVISIYFLILSIL